jgi:O-acetylserine/cysteine efflux transporter
MTPRDTLSALVSIFFFGIAFIGIKLGVHETTPLLLTALRFVFTALPAVIFVRPPKASFLLTVLYGLSIGVGQFGALFIAIGLGMPIGLASLVIITLQVFITIFLAWILLRETPTPGQLIGAAIALLGILTIGAERLQGATFGPFLLVVLAAVFWAIGNIISKLAGKIDMFAFVVWAALVVPPPLIAASLIVEGPAPLAALLHPSLTLILCVALLAYGATVISYGLWARLLALYSAAQAAPFALLIPIIGMLSGALVFSEPLTPIELTGAALVMAGLAFNVFGDRLIGRRERAA